MEGEPRSPKDMSSLMRAALEKLLSEVSLVRVVFINHPLLVAPEGVKPEGGGTATFEYGLDLPVPIDELEITDEGIKATLSFSRIPRPTFVPWEAVVAILSPDQGPASPVPPKPKIRPKLSLVP